MSRRARSGAGVDIGIAFALVHVACLSVILVGASLVAVLVGAVMFVVRALAITAVYHRGLSHRAYRMSRPVQFVGAFVGAAAAQRGPLWWVGHHRVHHRKADHPGDPHSPVQVGFGRAHVGWQFERDNRDARIEQVPDLVAFPELRWLDRWHYSAPVTLAVACVAVGMGLHAWAPGLGADGPQVLVWGFVVSTVVLWHVTFSVNSFAHRYGRQPFDTRDTSRNNWVVALLAMGEGWHNNHHRYPASARHGFFPGQLDATHALLRGLARLGIVSDLKPVPESVTAGVASARGPRR